MYKFVPINRLTLGLQKAYTRFLKIRGQPREIALGFSLGLFVGMTPFMGFHTAIAVFFAALLKWNKFSAAVGVWITNPLTAPFVYSVTYFIGSRVFSPGISFGLMQEQSITSLLQMLQKTPAIFWTISIGGFLLGLPLAVAGYYFSYSAVVRYQGRIKQKIAEKKARRARKQRNRAKSGCRAAAQDLGEPPAECP